MYLEGKCRSCGHVHRSICTITRYHIRTATANVLAEHCPCEEYVPCDNLEYLEWKYNNVNASNG